MRNKLFLVALLVLVLATPSFAAVGVKVSGTMLGQATDIDFNSGFTSSSFDGSTLTVSAAAGAITGGTITGATINSSTIGQATPAAGSFTTLTSSGNATFSGATTTVAGTLSAATATVTGGTISGTAISGATITNSSIGSSNPSTGAFTTLSSSGTNTLSGTTNLSGTLNAATANLTGKLSGKVIVHATSVLTSAGTVAVDASGNDIFYINPTSTGTLTATGYSAGQIVRFIIYTSGTASTGTLTFGTGFKSTGTLTMPAYTGKYSIVSFVCDGTNLIQIGTFPQPL
jgi:hypothetical protein